MNKKLHIPNGADLSFQMWQLEEYGVKQYQTMKDQGFKNHHQQFQGKIAQNAQKQNKS